MDSLFGWAQSFSTTCLRIKMVDFSGINPKGFALILLAMGRSGQPTALSQNVMNINYITSASGI